MTTPVTGEDRPSRAVLREATLTGVRWVAFGRLLSETVAFGAMVWLAHLVSPEEFGRAAVALIVSALAMSLALGGFGTPLVQRATVERAHLEAGQLVSLVVGAILALLVVVVAPVVCDPLFGVETRKLVQFMAPAFLLANLGVVGQAVLQRRLDFRRLSVIEMSAVTLGSVASVGLAAAGLGARAIVFGALTMIATLSVLQVAATSFVIPRWHPREMRELLAFGIPSALSSLVDVSQRNVDYVILGAKLAPAQVGFYWRAFQLGVDHQRKISGVLMRIALPVYSRAADAEHRNAIRARMVRVQTAVLFPLLAFLVAVAPTLVPWLLGARWEPAVVPTQILAIAGMAVAVVTGLGPLLLAAGRPRALLVYNLISAVAFGATVLFTAPHGLTVVCLAVAAFYVLQVLAAHWFLLDRLLHIPMRQVFRDITPAAVCSATVLGIAAFLTRWLDGLPAPVALGVAGLVAAGSYAALLRLLFAATWSDLVMLAGRVLGRPVGRDPAIAQI